MKVRNGFVSNSSSSSFVLYTCEITEKQLHKFMEYFSNEELNCDGWSVNENKERGVIRGRTIMDNDELYEWLKENMPDILAVIEFVEDI